MFWIARCPHQIVAARISTGRRFLANSSSKEPTFDTTRFLQSLKTLAPAIAASLSEHGYWTNFTEEHQIDLFSAKEIDIMREQAIVLRRNGRFEPSWSESIDEFGVARRFDKPGVFACEPDGGDYSLAPDLLTYMSAIIQQFPTLLNSENIGMAHISNQAFNAKLAVTSPGGSVYPLHVDNPIGGVDTRKLTCILYLNHNYCAGELRLLLLGGKCLDLSPCAGRMVAFWSDEIPHEVLPCAPEASSDDEDMDRYALTIWLPDHDAGNIHRNDSKFESLRVGAFMSEHWC